LLCKTFFPRLAHLVSWTLGLFSVSLPAGLCGSFNILYLFLSQSLFLGLRSYLRSLAALPSSFRPLPVTAQQASCESRLSLFRVYKGSASRCILTPAFFPPCLLSMGPWIGTPVLFCHLTVTLCAVFGLFLVLPPPPSGPCLLIVVFN